MTAMQRHRRGVGFTITEAVVVMVITSVVMALLLPGLGRARDHAKTAQGLENLRQLGQGVYIMAIDMNNTLPYGYWDGTPWNSDAVNDSETDWMLALNDYLAGGGSTYTGLADGTRQNVVLPIFRDPNATYPDNGLHHYIGHPLLLPDRDVVEDVSLPATKAVVRYRLSRIRRPDEVVLAMDGIQVYNTNVNVINNPLVQYTSRAGADDMDGGALRNQSAGFLNTAFYDEGDNANDTLINPGANQDGVPSTVPNPALNFDIRWRQNSDTAANFVFPDGHSETLGMNEVRKRNVRVDR